MQKIGAHGVVVKNTHASQAYNGTIKVSFFMLP